MMEFLREFLDYVRVRRKFWLLPLMIVLGIIGGLLAFVHSSALAPFIYTLF